MNTIVEANTKYLKFPLAVSNEEILVSNEGILRVAEQ